MIAILASVLVLASSLAPTLAAEAAGTAVLNVTVEPVDYATGVAQTDAAFGTHGDKLAYKVSYSCAVAACEGATINLSPSQADPYGLAAQGPTKTGLALGSTLLAYSSWTKPDAIADATIGGDDASGKSVSLGNLNAGSSGSLLVVYDITATGTYTTARPAQFYPDGFQIQMSATIDATSAVAPVTAGANPVTWHIEIPDPGVHHSNPGAIKPDTNTTYSLLMGSGSFPRRDSGAITGTPQWIAASNYTAVEQLPAEAVYVSSSNGGVYDAASNTVTWTAGTSDEPDYLAAGGWGTSSTGNWVGRNGYGARSVVVTYPASNFPAADANGCNFTASVSSTLTTTVTYLDPAHTTKTATTTAAHDVSCYDPFGRVDSYKDSTNNGTVGDTRIVYVPKAGGPANQFYWRVTAYNGGNVPGVAVVTDNDLDQDDAHVTRIAASSAPSSIQWTLNDGTTGTATNTVTAPDGSWFTAATTTLAPLAPLNVSPADNRSSSANVAYYYAVTDTAPVGEQRTNTASIEMSYPGYPDIGTLAAPDRSRTIQFGATPGVKPVFGSSFPTPAGVEGGGNAVPGRNVTFAVNGATSSIPAGQDITPEYVFIAPVGWQITNGSASFPAASVPDGVTFTYATKTIGTDTRDVVVAKWPDSVAFGANGTWPTMSVTAQPTYAVAAGTTSAATAWAGDSRQSWSNADANYGGAVQNTADVAGDGNVEQWFASSTQNILVSSADGLSAIKEICQADLMASDGCTWVSDPAVVVGVAPTATNIEYRITLKNTGNTTVSDAVAYDVLPYIGDTGTSAGAASTPRGSTFAETINSVSSGSPSLQLSFSNSTNPKRDEVYPAAPGAVDDWGSDASGKQAIRAKVTSALAPGDSVSFGYVANVASGATADAKACNSVAVDSAQTLPAEPLPVCASTQEADLIVTVPSRLPLQVARAGVIPFTVTNGGGSQAAPATVTVQIPAGLTVTSLTPDGWACTADPDGATPIVAPVTLNCDPVDGDGAPRMLQKDDPNALNVAVIPTASSAPLCVPASVTGPMSDPQLSNNDTSGCFTVAAATGGLALTKDDGRAAVSTGDEYTYTLTAANLLPAESIADAVVTDTLPAGLAFVSATNGGTVSGQGTADAFGNLPGGTVSWSLPTLAAAGTANTDGDGTTGGAGSSSTITVTVKVLPGASGEVTNVAAVDAADPADPTAQLHADASDIDGLRALAITKSSDARAAGVRTGDTVSYTVTATNRGTADYTSGVPAIIHDDLSGVLDDATFVAGSAKAVVASGSATSVSDPAADILSWSGALSAGSSAVLTYSVTVTDVGDKTLANAAFGGVAMSTCDPATGADSSGTPCATTTSTFAPVLTKTVDSFAQNDDGTWTTVYDLDVVNPNPATDADYSLSDELGYGAGIDVLTAEVTSAPSGTTSAAWSGSGTIATDVALPAAQTDHWMITVTADAHGVASTPQGSCLADTGTGFVNTATLTLSDATTQSSEACAEPAKPTVTKTLDGNPVRNDDGSWNISYLITVSNASVAPSTGLVYSLRDQLAYPAGVTVSAVTVEDVEAGGATPALNPAFNGGLTTIGGGTVAADPKLLVASDRVAAATGAGAAEHRYRVTVTARSSEATLGIDDVTCGPDGSRGYRNGVELWSTDTVIGTGNACADIAVPKLRFTKTADTTGAVHPGDTITYTVTAKNVGDADFIAGDPAALQDDMSGVLDDASYGADASATSGDVVYSAPQLLWSGAIAAGKTVTITYTVKAGKAGVGDNALINVISPANDPASTIPACVSSPDDNSAPCSVTNPLVELPAAVAGWVGLAKTGVGIVASAGLALLALMAGLAIALLARRRRRLAR